MKIGFAQINTTVGDLSGNAERILKAYRQCVKKGADLVLTPELAITGYPPRDLVFKSRFVPACMERLEQIASEAGSVPLITGYIDRNASGAGAPFTNSAAVLHEGKIAAKADKCLLPSYDVFDEARYFQPSCDPVVWEFEGRRIGITICEDIWTEEYLPTRLYVENPPEALAKQHADLIVNLSASPFHSGKPRSRAEMVGKMANKLGLPIAYCNSVSGNDSLIFDGYSMLVGADGNLRHVCPGFEECVSVADLDTAHGANFQDDLADIHDALVLGLRDYIRKCGFEKVLIGLSGGIDSALTAAIATEALGPENVLGVTLPSQYSSSGSVSDSEALAKNLGISFEEIAIREPFESVKKGLQPLFQGREEDVTEENIQARIRGVILMAISNKFGHLLLTTGNKSELAVGYCTIYGDMSGGLAVISDLPKTTVYALSRWINRDREIIPWNTIEKPPSAELRPDQKDQDSLPEYDLLDEVLELYVEESLSVSDIIERGFDEETVRWICRRVDLNEWKRQQAALGLRVTSKAFGMGRRIPIAQRFVG